MKEKCNFCGRQLNIIVTKLNDRYPICHICFNQARRCRDGLQFKYRDENNLLHYAELRI